MLENIVYMMLSSVAVICSFAWVITYVKEKRYFMSGLWFLSMSLNLTVVIITYASMLKDFV